MKELTSNQIGLLRILLQQEIQAIHLEYITLSRYLSPENETLIKSAEKRAKNCLDTSKALNIELSQITMQLINCIKK